MERRFIDGRLTEGPAEDPTLADRPPARRTAETVIKQRRPATDQREDPGDDAEATMADRSSGARPGAARGLAPDQLPQRTVLLGGNAHRVALEAAHQASQPGLQQQARLVTGWLVVVAGPGRGAALTLGFGRNSLGRGIDNDVCIGFGDETMSERAHAFIAYDARSRGFALLDGMSRNLTYLDGQPVYQPQPLKGGEVVTLGRTDLKFVPFAGVLHDWDG